MPGWIDIQLVGDQRGVDAMLNRIEMATSPVGLELFMRQMVEPWIQNRARERFRSEGDDVTGPWAPLKPATEQMRSQSGYGAAHPINERTTQLRDYITQSSSDIRQLGLGAVMTYPGPKATGELRDKVETAQAGKAFPSTVARPVLGMNENDLLAVLTGLATFIQVGTP